MLLLGHACWGYLLGRFVGDRLNLRPNLWVLLIMGMLPDVDLVFGAFGLPHRTLTHSVLFWLILFAPFFMKYRFAALPYFVAVAQHILFGDLIVGRTSIIWPITDPVLGLGLPILSPLSLALEGIGFGLFCIVAVRNGDLAAAKIVPLGILVIAPLIAFVILASFSESLLPLFLEGSDAKHLERSLLRVLSSQIFQAAIILHVALIAALLVPHLKTILTRRVSISKA